MTISPPDGLSVFSTLAGSCLRISWYPVINAVSYGVYRSEIPYGDFSRVAYVNGPVGLTYFDIPPGPNDNIDNLWYYEVTAVVGCIESDLSGPATYINYVAFENAPIPGLSWSELF